MAKAKLDPQILAHLEWIGFVRPTGLVFSAPALVRAGAILDRRDTEGQRLLRACVEEREFDPEEGPVPHVTDFRTLAESVLGWSFAPKGYAGTSESPIPPELEVPLPDYGETLRTDFAVREMDPRDGEVPWQLLVRVLKPGQDFDRVVREGGRLEASAHGRMERLLRRTGVPAGLLFNGRTLRLVSAPSGESSGWLDFSIADMVQTAGRPISTAMRLLLSERRLLALPTPQRLAALLDDSRKFQNEVSERLAEQVLHALYELLRGFQAAHDASKGELLREVLAEHPDEVYRAQLTVILRLVFVLYAEERDMLPEGETFLRYYSLAGLHERLREDAALFPDTMDQRYGAWAQLLALFRMIYDGAESDGMRLPKRHGVLFDPDRFKFLEGRSTASASPILERVEAPLVPDGTIYRALEKLLVLDGERISYRALDVEQIGSVYETMMGFRLETATGRSVAIKAPKRHGAPMAVDLESLLAEPAANRDKWLRDRTDRKLTDKVKKAAKESETLEDLHAALLPVIDVAASPDLVPPGAMVLQPSEERRRSGSHYTPRALTEPIVRTTLEPILERLRGDNGQPPRPEQLLDLKICDPAMGSGAFLVETCRQLGAALVEAWHAYDALPEIPPDEDEVILARRLIAQRCIYGVDRNLVAVDLAKMSLWLVTLAKDHALTFVDHALRHGDSLVGLSRKQIEAFHWKPGAPGFRAGFEVMRVREHMAEVARLRQHIREANDRVSDQQLRNLWDQAQSALDKVRLFGDLVLAAFFAGSKAKEREAKRAEYADAIASGQAEHFRGRLREWRYADSPLVPFHWEIEFPEVFERDNPGFDAFVGNPPFAGKNNLIRSNLEGYLDWLKSTHAESHGNADLVAQFFRRVFDLLSNNGAIGLIATKTVHQGDTRETGLKWICEHRGVIYAARRYHRWPGRAAVIVSIIHVYKGQYSGPIALDGRRVAKITAYLFDKGTSASPSRLNSNSGKSFVGNYVLGAGFTFDDRRVSAGANPVSTMRSLLAKDPRNGEIIRPYINGADVNEHPNHEHHKWVINFGRMEEAQARSWPDLYSIVAEKVRPARLAQNREIRARYWWRFAETAPALYEAIKGLRQVLVRSLTSANFTTFTFLPIGMVYDQTLIVFAFDTHAAFTVLNSRCHEVWGLFLGGSIGETPRYNPARCFETFPFPAHFETIRDLEETGRVYYEFRVALMIKNAEGLTKTYNRFHDPNEQGPEFAKLRELHSAMDRAVFDAFGWSDLSTDCDFLLDRPIADEEDDRVENAGKYQYRWPDGVHDEVLARLLELNAERAKEEACFGTAETKGRGTRAKRNPKAAETRDLFDGHTD